MKKNSVGSVSESTTSRKLTDSALSLNRYRERYYATGRSGGICGQESVGQTDRLLLIYFGRGQWVGHFEQETDEIIPRLWQRHSDQPYMVADTIPVNQQNKDDVSDWLARYLISIGAQQTDGPAVNVNWHKKTFGTAQMTQLGIKKHPSVKRGMSLGC